MRKPSNNPITLPYGSTDASAGYSVANPHGGTDFSFQPDDRIYAPEAGQIVHVGVMGAAGNTVELVGAGGRKWRFCHLQSYNVQNGQQINEGHIIGVMGETGLAFGRHLHLVLFVNGIRCNPMSVLNQVKPPQPVQASTQTNNGRKLVDANDLNHIYKYGPLSRDRGNNEGSDVYIGKPAAFVIADHLKSDEYKQKVASKQTQLNGLNARISQLEQQATKDTATIKALTIERDKLQAELTALKANDKKEYDFVEEGKVVIVNVSADKLNLRLAPELDGEVIDTVANGASVATLGYVTNGADVNGNTHWYKTLNGYYFTAAFANDAPELSVEEKVLEQELDQHIAEIESGDFRDSFDDRLAGTYTAKQDVTVYDYSNKTEPVQCHAGNIVHSAGTFKRLGIVYHLTKKSTLDDNGKKLPKDKWLWRGVPANVLDINEYDDWLYAVSETPAELLNSAANGVVTYKDKIGATLGRAYAIIQSIATTLSRKKS